MTADSLVIEPISNTSINRDSSHDSRPDLQDASDTKTANTLNLRHELNIRNFFRNLRLQFLLWKSPTENRKIAAYKSRPVAGFHTFLHLIPLSGAATLLVLHWIQYWIGNSLDNTTALQFVAKFHELLMQASIVDVLIYIVRTQAIGGFIPLGALSVVAQPTRLSYLWSLDFIALLSASEYKRWRKAMFAICLPLMLLMTALVGPSTAVLMIPKPNIPHRTNSLTIQQNLSESTLFPSTIDKSHGMEINFKKWMASSFMGGTILDNGTSQIAKYQYSDHGTIFSDIHRVVQCFSFTSSYGSSDNYGIATIPTMLSVEIMFVSSPKFEIGSNFTLSTNHPLVLAQCARQTLRKGNADYASFVSDNGTRLPFVKSKDLYEDALRSKRPSSRNTTRVTYPPPLWMRSPEANSTSLLGIFFTLYNGSVENTRDPEFSVCTISPFWRVVETVLFESQGLSTVQTNVVGGRADMKAEALRPIYIRHDEIPSLHAEDFTQELNLSDGYEFQSMLAVLFAAALSNIPPVSGIVQDVHTSRPIGESEIDTKSMTSYNVHIWRSGYGYGTTSASVRVSIAALSAYCFVTISYIIYILATGSTSTAWSSAIELIMLALRSKGADGLGYTSAGIDSLHTLRRNVGIRATADDELELVFANDSDDEKQELKKVEPNKLY